MRQFLIIALVLVLLVAVGASLTVAIVLYLDHQNVQGELEASATRTAELEDQLGEAQVALGDQQAENKVLQNQNDDQQTAIATLQAGGNESGHDPAPLPEVIVTPAPEQVVPPTPTLEPAAIDPETAETMDEIERQVAGLRGLEPLRAVTRTLFTQDELNQYIVSDFDEEYSPEEVERDVLELAAFDFVSPDIDLRSLLEDLFTEQIAGFYDPEAEFFAIIDEEGELGAMDKTVYAHEFTHALQDQYYDLELLDPEENTDDASLAINALIEGDAVLLMQMYMLDYLDSDEIYELLSESLDIESSVLDSAPPLIQAQLEFPYVDGLFFVQALYDQGGYAAVDTAFANPPQSTEQILHPERYFSGEQPAAVTLPPLTDTLGSGWEYINDNVVGEFGLQLYLEEQVSEQLAAAAADGWGGDWYAVHAVPETDELVLVLKIAWDAPAEADEFMSAYRTYGKGRFGFAAEGDCWAGEDAICLYQSGGETLIIRAPDMGTVLALKMLFSEF